jgi:putative Mn2+ efflux pump MntP
VTGWQALCVVPAFGVDTFVVSVGLGMAGVPSARRMLIAAAIFEGVMPIVGTVAGSALGPVLAGRGVWVAAALLVGLGVLEIREWIVEGADDVGDAPARHASATSPPGLWSLALIGLSISLDELGAGFAVGTAGAPPAIFGPALALQAALFTYLGIRAGGSARQLAGRYGGLAAGVALLAVAPVILSLAGRI